MSDATLNIPRTAGSVFRTNTSNALIALATKHAGLSAPAETHGHMFWADETNNLHMIRNKANTAWLRAGYVDAPMLGHHGAQVQSKSAAYTVVKADAGSIFFCSNTFTLTLPAVTSLGNPFCFTVVNTGTGLITIDPDSSELIDGGSTLLVGPGDAVSVVGDSSTWRSFGQRAGMVLLDRQIASNVAQIDLKNVFGTRFESYEIVLSDIVPATDNVELWCRFSEDNGTTFVAGATDYKYAANVLLDSGTRSDSGSTGAAQIKICFGIGNGAGEGASGSVSLNNPGGSKHKQLRALMTAHNQTPAAGSYFVGGVYKATTNVVNAVRFMMSSGNITSGTFTLYGLRK